MSLPSCAAVILALLLPSAAYAEELSAFTSDACSLFPERSDEHDWCNCCFEHDVTYWRGGSKDERKQADERMRDCIEARTGSGSLARAMYLGVRAGGNPYWPTSFRWGYGWPYGRGYQSLTETENASADELFSQWQDSDPEPVCPVTESP